MNRWERLQSLFNELIDLDDDVLAGRLAEFEKSEPELAAAVGRLAAADRDTAGIGPLLEGGFGLDTSVDEEDRDALVGTAFGPYVVGEPIGSGGMSHVYRAVRTSGGVSHDVAFKVLRRSPIPDDLLERFLRERKIVARLRHENVATFVDAGTLPDGRPFLAMELVEGEPLIDWVDARAVSTSNRLAIFLDVLSAVAHAHGSLCVHGDIKPSNVLVTVRGVPKLLDFGVAALLDAPACDGPSPLTPAYASPEQLRGEPLTVASDVYSLGTFLHELTHPKPDSDLGRIAAKAKSFDPRERYPSVERLIDDLRRLLDRRPITARPATPAYLVSRFLSRHRIPVALGTLVIAALASGLAGAEIGRRRAVLDASHGWGAHSEARAVATLYEKLLLEDEDDADRLVARCSTWLSEDVSARMPEAEAIVRLTLARVHSRAGRGESARRELSRVLAICEQRRGLMPSLGRQATELLATVGN